MYQLIFPQGKTKALTFSYDDAQIYDEKLVKMFDRYGLKATFHINSGRINKYPYINIEEIGRIYAGHEIACHGFTHAWMRQLSGGQLVMEVEEDRLTLEKYSGRIITGFSYPFGEFNFEIVSTLQNLGIEYARTTDNTGNFSTPGDFLRWDPTCHHNTALKNKELIHSFLEAPEWKTLPLLYIWGHSYEFERDGTWGEMEQLCKELSGREDIWYVTNLDYCRYIKAARNLVFSVDGTNVFNPSSTTVWLKNGDSILRI